MNDTRLADLQALAAPDWSRLPPSPQCLPPQSRAAVQPVSARESIRRVTRQRKAVPAKAAVASPPVPDRSSAERPEGHSALLQGLGAMGDISPSHMPWLLRLAYLRGLAKGGDSEQALSASARGLLLWKMALDRGLVPDDTTLRQLTEDQESPFAGDPMSSLRWPEEPLRPVLLRMLSQLGVAYFASKYPPVMDAVLRSLLELTCKYHKSFVDEPAAQEEEEAPKEKHESVAELIRLQAQRRAVRAGKTGTEQAAAAPSNEEEDEAAEAQRLIEAAWTPQRRIAETLVRGMRLQWEPAMTTLSRAGRAFEGLEALLGGGAFDLQGGMWRRKGWAAMDSLRERLEVLKELRDLVRSLGRGGGWGPLRRAPQQNLDMRGRPGLLRTTLEAQETRGLTRSDDISRLLPSEAAVLARGRTVRQARLLFFAKLAEKALQSYERDGWGEFPTRINPDRREIRPTADRGPILLCVDTSGSMRGPRETVAKALTLECMRAAREQERGCYVFAFSGPREVSELELNADMKSVDNLLTFLEKVFNGGSDFNEPIKRCLGRLTDAKWANSDILVVSDGELRQPGQEVMQKLAGAKDKLGLRVHGLIVGAPEKQRADPAVLKSLCSHILPSGHQEVLVSRFESWGGVNADPAMQFDWDDAAGNLARRSAGLQLEALRKAEEKRLRIENKGQTWKPGPKGGRKKKPAKPAASATPAAGHVSSTGAAAVAS